MHGRSLPNSAFDRQRASVQVDQGFNDTESKTGAFLFPAKHIARLMKRIEHLFHIILINAGSGIGDRHDGAAVVAAPERERHLASFRRELDRVRQQIVENLPNSNRVDFHDDRLSFERRDELHRFMRPRADNIDDATLQKLDEISLGFDQV